MICQKCSKYFSQNVMINGVRHHLTSRRKYCTDCVPLGITKNKSRLYGFTKSELQEFFDISDSYIEVLAKCGLSKNANNYKTLNRVIKEYNIDTSKIAENRKKNNKITRPKYDESNFLDLVEKGLVMCKPSRLLQLLVKFQIKAYKCEKCGVDSWEGKQLTLELHHKDGNSANNKLQNLEILCPNCHSQTDNFRFRNKKH